MTRIEPSPDRTPETCEFGDSCSTPSALTVNGTKYCRKHAMEPALDEINRLRREAQKAWANGAEWVIGKVEERVDTDEDSMFVRRLRRDMKLENPHRTTA